jgi:signal transduction histidine kinase
MKWRSPRFTYPLVILSLAVSIALQLAWLNQLFHAQQLHVKQELEWVASSAANTNTYLSIMPGHEHGENFKKFFLSPQWLQLRQAYNNIRFNQLSSHFGTDFKGDTTELLLSLKIFNGHVTSGQTGRLKIADSISNSSLRKADSIDLKRMDSLVYRQMALIGYSLKVTHVLYNYDTDKPEGSVAAAVLKDAAFKSQKYAYNLRFLKNYQLVAPSINGQLISGMRIYLISSCFMIILTCAVFYFILRSMRNQQLYAQARQAFTGNMTHELKTPVATVSVALESIIRYGLGNDPDKLQKYVNISRIELDRLNMMIEKVLNLEKMDNGHVRLRKELYDVQQGLIQVVSSMQLQTDNKKATIVYHPSTEPCFVNGDPVLLSNVFYNLIDNALKYGGKGVGIVVKCTAENGQVVISFTDNGPGIAQAYQERIFHRFFRVPENESTHQANGSGLGLNYVRFIIERHEGEIKVASELGKGSVFTIYLSEYHEV